MTHPVVNPLARCPPTCYACAMSPLSDFLAARRLPYPLCPRTPQHTYDIHELRTFTRQLNAWIVPLQSTSPQAGGTINQVIFALNHTFHEVELAYMVWRSPRVQTILQHGIYFPFLFFFGQLILRPCPTCRIPVCQRSH